MKNKLAGNFSFFTLLVGTMVPSFLGIGLFCLIKASAVDSWISILISSVISLIMPLLFIYVSKYEPTLSIRDKLICLFGKKGGFVANTLLCGLFLFMGINYMYNLVNFVVSQFLSSTPLYVVGICFSILIIYVNLKGIETLSRTTTIIFIISFIFQVMSIASLLPNVDVSNFKPILSDGFKDPIIGALYTTFINFTPILLLLIIPKDKVGDNKKYNKIVFLAYIYSCIFMLFMVLIVIGNLGIYLASIYQYPEYMVLKKIVIFSFLNRVENVIILQWIFGNFVTLSIIVYYISNTIKYNNRSKILPSVIIFLILYLSLKIFKNSTIYNNYNYTYTPYVRSALVIIYIIISVVIFIKKRIKKNKS